MAWPTTNIVTTGMDADSDSLPRTQILLMAQNVNNIKDARGAASGIASLGSDSKVPSAQLPTYPTVPSIATIAQAQAATDNTTIMTPLRVADAMKGGGFSLASKGSMKLPNGLIMKWGLISASGAVNQDVFTDAYPTAHLYAWATFRDLSAARMTAAYAYDVTQVRVAGWLHDGTLVITGEAITYLSIGY